MRERRIFAGGMNDLFVSRIRDERRRAIQARVESARRQHAAYHDHGTEIELLRAVAELEAFDEGKPEAA